MIIMVLIVLIALITYLLIMMSLCLGKPSQVPARLLEEHQREEQGHEPGEGRSKGDRLRGPKLQDPYRVLLHVRPVGGEHCKKTSIHQDYSTLH